MTEAVVGGSVMTVDGPLPAELIGVALTHEHLLLGGWGHLEPNYANSLSMELERFVGLGGQTIVDVSSIGLPRDPEFARTMAHRAGVSIVLGTGYYKSAWLEPVSHDATVEELEHAIVTELTIGIDRTDIRAGVIGEVGVSRRLTPTERRSLEASALSQSRTGAGISLHFEIASPSKSYHEVLDLLERAGADLRRVAVGHLVPRPDSLGLFRELATRGAFLGFDLFGQDMRVYMSDRIATPASVQATAINGLVLNGLAAHILVSQNVQHVQSLTSGGGHAYSHLLTEVVPVWREYGLTEGQVSEILVGNPARFLTATGGPSVARD